MKLAEGSRVVTLARTAHEEQETEALPPEEEGEELPDLTEEELEASEAADRAAETEEDSLADPMDAAEETEEEEK